MKRTRRFWTAVLVSLFVGSSASADKPRVNAALTTYVSSVEGTRLSYQVPAVLRPGYREVPKIISFGDPRKDRALSHFGPAATEKSVATYFLGGKRDLSDFDLSVKLSVIKFSAPRTPKEMGAYFESLDSEPLLLSSGETRVTFGSLKLEKIGDWEAIVIRSADLFHVSDVVLRSKTQVNGVTLSGDAHTTLQPYQLYYLPLSDQLVACVRVLHFEQAKLNAKWHEAAEIMAREVVASLTYGTGTDSAGLTHP